jgi:hypothetical protein
MPDPHIGERSEIQVRRHHELAMNETNATWGPPDLSSWRELPHVAGRHATESDVKLGHAVFFIAGENGSPPLARPSPMVLPCCAVLHTESLESSPLAVIAIQAEEVEGKILVGYRPLAGGNGICTLAELELLHGPDERFGTNATKPGV